MLSGHVIQSFYAIVSLPAAFSSSVKTVSRAPGAGTGVQGHLNNERLLGVLGKSAEQGCFSELPLLKLCPEIQSHIPLPDPFSKLLPSLILLCLANYKILVCSAL